MAVKKLKDGRWLCDIEPIKGNRFRKKFDTKGEAQRYELHIKNQFLTSEWKQQKRDTRKLSELIEIWSTLHGQQLSDHKKRLARLVAMCKALRDPVAKYLSVEVFAEYRAKRLETVTIRTFNNDLCFINALYNELKRLEVITYDNPLSQLKPLKYQEKSLSFLTTDQVGELLEQCKLSSNPHVYYLSVLCLAVGCRWSEAEAINNNRIKNGVVTIQRTKSKKVRSVPISEQLANELKSHWKKYGSFTSSMSSFRRVLAKCSFSLPEGQATHVLRHTFASHFVQSGGNLLVLQKILGHSTIGMTMKYAHLAPDHLQIALELNPLSTLFRHSTKEQKKPLINQRFRI